MRFFVLLGTGCLLAASALLMAIYGATPYAAVARLGQVPYYEVVPDGPIRLVLALTPERYAAYRAGGWALVGTALLGALALLRHTAYRRELRRLGQEARRAGAALRRTVGRLSGAERAGAGALWLGLGLTWGAWLLLDPPSPDEIASYDSFVREGAVAVTSFYPMPNNHLGYNLLAWVLEQLLPGQARLVMRLPSLLAALAGTALSYALLTHFRNFRTATLAVALFGFTKVAIIYAAAGRGYYVQLGCVHLAFFAAVGLASGPRYRRLGWAVFVGSSVAGLYVIPTFAAPLAALGSVLAGAALGRPPALRHRLWGQLVAAGVVVVATVAVLYAPVGCVSGWGLLLANRYVVAQPLATFWALGPAILYETAGMLLGPVRLGLLLSATLVALVPLALRRGAPAQWPARARWLAWASWALLVGPVALALAQRVFVPARALMYATFFLYLLAALGADWAATRWRGRWAAWAPLALLVGLLAFRGWELYDQVPTLRTSRAEDLAVARAYRWLRAQPSGPAVVGAPYHELMFDHYALLNGTPRLLHPRPVAGVRYPYLVWPQGPTPRPAWSLALPYRAAYQDELVVIYILPPAR